MLYHVNIRHNGVQLVLGLETLGWHLSSYTFKHLYKRVVELFLEEKCADKFWFSRGSSILYALV